MYLLPIAALFACSVVLRLTRGVVLHSAPVQISRLAPAEEIPETCCQSDELKKNLDIVIFGATGFTGKIAASYLAKGHQDRPRWAIAGRSQAKLTALSKELVSSGPDWAAPIEMLVADLKNMTSLLAVTQRAHVVLSFAGPYEMYDGEALIRAALKGCANYADITGETAWKGKMLIKYGEAAKKRGVALVQSVGYDSLPHDLLARIAAEAVAADGQGPPNSILLLDTKQNGFVSGGTLASGLWSAAHNQLSFDPYILVPETPPDARVDKTIAGMQHYGYDAQNNEQLFPSVMSSVNCPVVRRTLSTLFPRTAISVSEATNLGSNLEMAKFFIDPRMLFQPPPPPFIGMGPPQWMREKGSFAAQATAQRMSDGRKKVVFVEGHGDPGYQATAQMSVEFALGLAMTDPQKQIGGYFTPALALAPNVLRARLENAIGGKLMHFAP